MALLLNHLGTFSTIEQVWAAHPEGGREGDYVTIGTSTYYWDKNSRCWVQSNAIPSGGGGSQVVSGDLSVTGNLGVGGDAVINGRLIVNGQEVVPGTGGSSGGGGNTGTAQLAFKSIVFKRSNGRPLPPTDGAFGNPIPYGWYDSVPQGTAPIWMSSRYFTSDGQRPAGVNSDNWNVWSTPAQMSDTEDFDVEFSPAPTTNVPGEPATGRTHGGTYPSQVWFDPVKDPTADWSQMNWMATRSKYVDDSGSEAWTQWKIILIKGEKGDDGSDGDGFRSVYTIVDEGVIPEIADNYYPPSGRYGVVWWPAVPNQAISEGLVLWMAEQRCVDGVWGPWSSPVRLSGYNGANGIGTPGEDGANIEFIYKRSDSLPGASDTAPESVNEDGAVPESEGWADHPSGVDATHKYEWMCQRVKSAGHNQPWGPWRGPFVWSAFGEKGMDGDGLEYVFRLSGANQQAAALQSTLANPSYMYTPTGSESAVVVQNYRGGVKKNTLAETQAIGGEAKKWIPEDWDGTLGDFIGWSGGQYNDQGEWIPTGWRDNPESVTKDSPKEWVSTRKRHDGKWGNWAPPALWATYSETHTVEIDSEGFWLIDGQRVYRTVDGQQVAVSAEGKDGNGVRVQGVRDYLTATQAGDNAAGITGRVPTSLYGMDLTDVEVGDCYVVDYVDVAAQDQSNWVRGYLFVYNGASSSDPADKWTSLGQFRGEAGESQYMHIAWATAINGAGTANPTVPTGGHWCWAWEDRQSNREYPWMGIRVNNEPGDPRQVNDYKWQHVRGTDGNSVEFVFIRTENNVNPGVDNSNQHAQSESEYLPVATNGEAAGAAYNESSGDYEYTDDPQELGNDEIGEHFFKYQWVSKRTRGSDGVWGPFSDPSLWSMIPDAGRGVNTIVDWYLRSMRYSGVEHQTQGWEQGYVEPNESLPYLWHYTQYSYTDGTKYNTPCSIIKTYRQGMVNDNLLNDTDFAGLGAMPAWDKKGSLEGNTADPQVHDVRIGEGKDGRNAFIVEYQNSVEDGHIDYLSQKIHTDNGKMLKPNTWYTFSFWQKGTVAGGSGNSNKSFRLDWSQSELEKFLDTGEGVKMYYDGVELASTPTIFFTPDGEGGWTYHVVTFKTKAVLTAPASLLLRMYTRSSHDTMQVCMPKLEEGRMATSYFPAKSGGPSIRTGEWRTGMDYMQGAEGEPYIDVARHDGKWYRCLRSHRSTSATVPTTATDLWEEATGFSFVATDLLLAQNASINLLSGNVINLFNQAGEKTVSINADQQGSYCIYYPPSPFNAQGNKRMEFRYDGWIYYYNDDEENTIAWMLGKGGDIIKTTSVSMSPILLSASPVDLNNYSLNGTDTAIEMRTCYVYANDKSDNHGKVYDRADVRDNEPTGNVIGDGNYATTAVPLQRITADGGTQYYQPYVVIDGGKITQTKEKKGLILNT